MTVYADLLRYRELFGNLFRRDFQAKYRGSALGVLWSLLDRKSTRLNSSH